MVFSMVSSRDDIPVACQYPKSRSTHRMSGGWIRQVVLPPNQGSRRIREDCRETNDRLRQRTAAIRSYRRVHSCQITVALTGPPPINMDLRNDAIGGSASNALLCTALVGILPQTKRLLSCPFSSGHQNFAVHLAHQCRMFPWQQVQLSQCC